MKKEIPGQLSIFDIFGLNCFKSNNQKSTRSDEDYLLDCVLHGSGFTNGKTRIYDIINSGITIKDQIAAIKKEYGIGGAYWSCNYIGVPNVLIGFQTYGTKGMQLLIQDENCEEKKLEFSWSEVRKAIVAQIKVGIYLESQNKRNIA